MFWLDLLLFRQKVMMTMMMMMIVIIALKMMMMMMMMMKPHLRTKKLVPYCAAHNNTFSASTNVRELPPFPALDLTVSSQNKFPAGEYLGFYVKGVGEEMTRNVGNIFGVSEQQKS